MHSFNRIILWLGVFLCAALVAAGCGGGDQPEPGAAAQAGDTATGDAKPKGKSKASAAAPKSPEAEAAVLEETIRDWRYDPGDKWDPFVKPPAPISSPSGIDTQYDLDQMLLLGVVAASRESMSAAYLRMPNGKDKIVQIGDIVGKHGGEVKEIGKDFIIVEEKYMDPQHPNDTFIIEKELKLHMPDKK